MSEKIICINNAQEFDNLINKEKFVLVDFWATWCIPCRMLTPVIDKLADQYEGKLVVAKVDVDINKELTSRYEIQGIPTVALFKEGKIVFKEAGIKSLAVLKNLIDFKIA